LDRLDELVDRLEEVGAAFHPTKLAAGHEVPFLGEIRTPNGFVLDPSKLEALTTMLEPRNQTELRSVIGMFKTMTKHVKDLNLDLAPLNIYTSSKRSAKFTPEETAYLSEHLAKAQKSLANAMALSTPRWDLPFILHCDASDAGVGGSLSQVWEDGFVRYIKFFAQPVSGDTVATSTFSKEARAIVFGIEQCADYIIGTRFILKTDHKPLLWVLKKAREAMQGARKFNPVFRWATILSTLNFDVEHISGTANVVADALSRPPFVRAPESPYSTESPSEGVKLVHNKSHYIQRLKGQTTVAAIRAPDSNIPPKDKEEANDRKAVTAEEVEVLGVRDFRPFHSYDPNFPVDAYEAIARVVLTRGDAFTIDDLSENLRDTPEILESVMEVKSSLVLHNDSLHWCRENGDLVPYVPVVHRDELMFTIHNAPTGGHFGVDKTLLRLKERCWWPAMNLWVQKYCTECGPCQRNKSKPSLKAPQQTWEAASVWERIHLDLIEMNETERGNKWILNVVDSCSKKLFSFPIPDKSAATVMSVLLSLFDDVGRPWTIATDGGREFDNKLLDSVCQQFQIRKHVGTPYNHQSQGMVEVMNRILETILRMNGHPSQHNWDLVLPESCVAWNDSRPLNGARSPNDIWFGRSKRTPLEVFLNTQPPQVLNHYDAWRKSQ
jgi:hypothetical protein